MNTATVLKSIYNQILIDQGTWQGYVTHAADSLTKQIAQSRVDAYTDILTIINNQLMLLGPY